MKQQSNFTDDIALAPPSMTFAEDLSVIETVEEEPDTFAQHEPSAVTNFVYDVASSLYSLLQNRNPQHLEADDIPQENDLVTADFSRLESPVDNFNNVDECAVSMISPERSNMHLTPHRTGSSVYSATFNYVNCIVGAGAIGLGGAFAQSGGLISVFSVAFFAYMVKLSTDLVIRLSLDYSATSVEDARDRHFCTYEGLGMLAYGKFGRFLVMGSKFLYAFGCLVAYTKVIQDNFGAAIKHLLFKNETCNRSWPCNLLSQDVLLTYLISAAFVLPLCLLREMSSLSRFSILSIIAMISIIGIVFYFWIWGDVTLSTVNSQRQVSDQVADNIGDSSILYIFELSKSNFFYRHWIEIHLWKYFNNIGTFVFSFVCQHTAHLTFSSLRPDLRTMKNWKKVSGYALFISTLMSLTVGLIVYMTFWENAVSDIFQLYPTTVLMDVAKLLLCTTMLLTFPLPFLACRELLIALFFSVANAGIGHRIDLQRNNEEANFSLEAQDNVDISDSFTTSTNDLRQALLIGELNAPSIGDETQNSFYTATSVLDNVVDARSDNGMIRRLLSSDSLVSLHDASILSARAIQAVNAMLIPDREHQLKTPYHFFLTCKLWFVATSFAVASPSLGDILSLIGCASGALIAFILPGLFALKLEGYRALSVFILVVGGIVGIVGTGCSLRKIYVDTFKDQKSHYSY